MPILRALLHHPHLTSSPLLTSSHFSSSSTIHKQSFSVLFYPKPTLHQHFISIMTSSEHTRSKEHEHEHEKHSASSPSAAAHVLESRPIPRAGDYEAQYFDTKEQPNVAAISRIGNPTGLAVVSFSTSLTIIGLALLQISEINLGTSFGAVGGE